VSADPGGLVVPDPGPSWSAGTGVLADLDALGHADTGLQGTVEAGYSAIGLMGALDDPLQTLLAVGAGWVIEHFGPLTELLDALAGNPTAIKANAQTLHQVSGALSRNAAGLAAGAQGLTSWQGAAAEGYRAAAAGHARDVLTAAGSTDALSRRMLGAAELIGTVRGTIRSTIAALVASVAEGFLVAAAASGPTAGASVAAWLLRTSVRIVETAARCVRLVGSLARRLAGSGALVRGLGARLDEMAEEIARKAGRLRERTTVGDRDVGERLAADLGDTRFGSRQELRDWVERAAPSARADLGRERAATIVDGARTAATSGLEQADRAAGIGARNLADYYGTDQRWDAEQQGADGG
jgi:hypothetical protein